MTVHIVYISQNRAEKRKIRELQYPTFDQFDELVEQKIDDILKFIEQEEQVHATNRLA